MLTPKPALGPAETRHRPSRDPAYAAIVLAGGLATRFGGVDKTAIEIDGVRIIDRVLSGVAGADPVIVVGPEVRGGPVAAIASAVGAVRAPVVVTLAGDQPWIATAVPLLVTGLGEADVAVLASDEGRHYLAAAWRTSSLTTALSRLESPENAAVRALFKDQLIVDVPDLGGWSRDIDSPADLPD